MENTTQTADSKAEWNAPSIEIIPLATHTDNSFGGGSDGILSETPS